MLQEVIGYSLIHLQQNNMQLHTGLKVAWYCKTSTKLLSFYLSRVNRSNYCFIHPPTYCNSFTISELNIQASVMNSRNRNQIVLAGINVDLRHAFTFGSLTVVQIILISPVLSKQIHNWTLSKAFWNSTYLRFRGEMEKKLQQLMALYGLLCSIHSNNVI